MRERKMMYGEGTLLVLCVIVLLILGIFFIGFAGEEKQGASYAPVKISESFSKIMDRMKTDIDPENDRLPIKWGAFPVPDYKSLHGFPYRGGGSISSQMARSMEEYRLMVEDKEIAFCTLHIGNSELYPEGKRNKTFFTIITVIDTIDEETNFSI